MDEIETPSGKGARDENFPVGSWLLPARLRPHVATFYRFARGADDIADNPSLAPEDKVARLNRLAEAVRGNNTDDPAARIAHDMRTSLAATGVAPTHCLDILDAFRQDATKTRYADWTELMAYCERSANPVGRYLLDLHGEDAAGYPASDSLCSALQVINHLQDAKDDLRHLDRVYVPQDWLADEGLDVMALGAPASDARLRRVLDRCLDGVDHLLVHARALPQVLRSGRLAVEAAAIASLAEGLAGALRRQDPVAGRVAHTKGAFAVRSGAGVLRTVVRRTLGGGARANLGPRAMTATTIEPPAAAQAHVREVVDRSGTSFRWSMKILPPQKRRAMYAVYAFCREVDDVADEPGDVGEKESALDGWRREIDALYSESPTSPTAQVLGEALRRFDLPKQGFLDVIDGMAMDLRGEMRAPRAQDLDTYCDRVAGAVGRLSLPIFGGAEGFADDLARALGQALQLTNILRDLGEDARLGRLYLPRERLRAHGIDDDAPNAVLQHPNVGLVCREIAALARQRFNEGAALIARGDRRNLRPCRIMMAVYGRTLDGLEQRGWDDPTAPFDLPRATKLWLALRHALF